MKIKLYNLEGKSTQSVEVKDDIFKKNVNPSLTSQVVQSFLANKRFPIAKTKNRGEVSGGGRKPFRQKGTGNARSGSNRSPVWIGGGVTFGPTNNRNFKKNVPDKMKIQALKIALSQKAKNNQIIIIDDLNLKNHKTKQMQAILEKLPLDEGKILVIVGKTNVNLELATANLPFLKTLHYSGINLLDLLNYNYLLTDKNGIKKIQENFYPNKIEAKK